jgi:hypothetical protein
MRRASGGCAGLIDITDITRWTPWRMCGFEDCGLSRTSSGSQHGVISIEIVLHVFRWGIPVLIIDSANMNWNGVGR